MFHLVSSFPLTYWGIYFVRYWRSASFAPAGQLPHTEGLHWHYYIPFQLTPCFIPFNGLSSLALHTLRECSQICITLGPFWNAACPTYFLRLCCASSRACASSGEEPSTPWLAGEACSRYRKVSQGDTFRVAGCSQQRCSWRQLTSQTCSADQFSRVDILLNFRAMAGLQCPGL